MPPSSGGKIHSLRESVGYGTPTWEVELGRAYTLLIALAFELEEFYPIESIDLYVMPPPSLQREYLSLFLQRVHSLMKESLMKQRLLTSVQAEQIVWGTDRRRVDPSVIDLNTERAIEYSEQRR